ncbi:MAG: heavy-metal-associated domain-containing protein [Chloroflexi bacterium]|nr:heavy-metal-associated domain-containing protein [Chloroflexota bacterium]
MQTKTFAAPALYGDHHVMEVRRILLGTEGVVDVYASSAFQVIEVTFDPKKIKAEQIEARLREAGYLDELPIPAEPAGAVRKVDDDGAFRHTAVYETVKNTVAFAQRVNYQGRPLWPCPGMGVVKAEEQ